MFSWKLAIDLSYELRNIGDTVDDYRLLYNSDAKPSNIKSLILWNSHDSQ